MNIVEQLKALRELAKRPHYECEDCWYTCPKADGGSCNDSKGDDCDCGADAYNAKVDEKFAAIIAQIEAMEPVAWARYDSKGFVVDVLAGYEPIKFLHGENKPLYAFPEDK